MKLTILTENVAGGRFLAEHGLSYLIEHKGKSILFDTGHSDVFLKNAQQLGIDLQTKADQIVLSHGHWDHGDGLRFIQKKPLITHPSAFISRFRKKDQTPLGLSLTKKEAEQLFDLTTSKSPKKITEEIYFLGEIPRQNNFESQSTMFVDKNGHDDYVPDDSALAIIVKDQLIIISGCAHSGICNICEYAKQVTGVETINAVIGGFHLKKKNKQTQKTINFFKDEKVENIYPSHCTELPALAAFHETFQIRQLKTGEILVF